MELLRDKGDAMGTVSNLDTARERPTEKVGLIELVFEGHVHFQVLEWGTGYQSIIFKKLNTYIPYKQ